MDKEYWDKFYKNNKNIETLKEASSFAIFCQEKFFKYKNKTILELGSGNGRDASYFSNNLHTVIAIDQSHEGLKFLSKNINKNLSYIKDDFVNMDYQKYINVDVVYSRFTLHAITEEECTIIINKVSSLLKKGDIFAIEVRSTQDPLCGKGKKIGHNTWFTDHSRRFVDSNNLINKILSKKFKLLYFTEEDNLSIYKDDNPVLIRTIFKKI
jgi:cyclopropane fatty-acyl-phospholipid synthase-like methyltransferase